MIPKGYTLGADGEYVCKFCFGRGCLSCPPLPPVLKEQPTEPLLSLSKAALEDHESDAFQVFKAAVGRDTVVREFSPGGGGHEAIRKIVDEQRSVIAARYGLDENGCRQGCCFYCGNAWGQHELDCKSPWYHR